MITVRRTYDEDLIRYVIGRLWDEVSDGSIEFEDWYPSDDEIWLKISNEDTLVGIYGIRFLNDFTIEGHANVLPEHRRKYTKTVTKGAAQWAQLNLPEQYTKLQVVIPIKYPNVLEYAYEIGLKEEAKVLSMPLQELYNYGNS